MTDSEIAEYDNVSHDIDVDNMPDGQYVVLCDKYYFKHYYTTHILSGQCRSRIMVVHQDGTNVTLYNQDKQNFEHSVYMGTTPSWNSHDAHAPNFSAPIIHALDNNGGNMNETLNMTLASNMLLLTQKVQNLLRKDYVLLVLVM